MRYSVIVRDLSEWPDSDEPGGYFRFKFLALLSANLCNKIAVEQHQQTEYYVWDNKKHKVVT